MTDIHDRLAALSPEQQKLLLQNLKNRSRPGTGIPGIPRQNPTRTQFPLSSAQERTWLSERLSPGTSINIMAHAFRLKGRLDREALYQSWQALIDRHQVLRSRYRDSDGKTVQLVSQSARLDMPVIDLSRSHPNQQEKQIADTCHQEANRPFDLETDMMLRVVLLHLAAEDHLLLLVLHRIAADDQSVEILLSELSSLYQAFTGDRPNPLSELPIQYTDYCVWQREWLESDQMQNQRSYWTQQLQGAPQVLNLPTDHSHPPTVSLRGGHRAQTMPPHLVQGLEALSRLEGATLFMVLLAAFSTLLSHYTGQEEMLVGTPANGRTRREIEGLVGSFANTLVMRCQLGGDPTFRQYLARVQKTAEEAFSHQDLPFVKLVEMLQPEREVGRMPLVQVLFVLQAVDGVDSYLRLPGLTVRPAESGEEVDAIQADLYLGFTRKPEGTLMWVDFNADIFEAATVDRMLDQMQTLLAGVVENPDCRLSALPPFSGTAGRQLPASQNDRVRDNSGDGRSCQLFEGRESLPLPQHEDAKSARATVAPRDNLERQLVGVWESVLERRPIGVTDNFFEIGGHSLLAAQLAARIEKVTGREFPLASIFQAPTIEQFVAYLRQEGQQTLWNWLVPVQTGGSRPPLFAVHSRTAFVYRLAQAVGPEQPIYGLEEQATATDSAYHYLIRNMAGDYIREMRGVQPQGPYYLSGYCFGGIVAYEIAQQLLEEGQEVGLLALLDVEAPGYQEPVAAAINRHRGKMEGLTISKALVYLTTRGKNLTSYLGLHIAYRFYQVIGRPIPRRVRGVTRADFHAIQVEREYQIRPYPNPITIYHGTREGTQDGGDPYGGWKPFVRGEIELRQVPGGHELVVDPYMDGTAQDLRDCLLAAQERMRHQNN